MAKKSLFASLEELQEAGAPAEGAVDGGETEIAEAGEAGAEMGDQIETIDEAHDDQDTLGAISEVLEDSVEDGGVDQATARVAEIAVESIYKRLGVKKKAMPSMESFGSRSSRVRATQIAIEGIGEVLSKIWEAIKNAFNQLWTWMKNVWKSLFDASFKLEERAKKLMDRLNTITGTAEESDFKDSTFYNKLSTGGSFSASGLVTSLGNFAGYTKGIKAVKTTIKTNTDNMKKVTVAMVQANPQGIFQQTGAASESVSKAVEAFFPTAVKEDGKTHDYIDYKGSPELPGNVQLIFGSLSGEAVGDKDKLSTAISYMGVTLGVYDKDKENEDDTECDVASISDMKAIVGKVRDLLAAFNNNKGLEADIESNTTSLTKEIDKTLKALEKVAQSNQKAANGGKADKDGTKDIKDDFQLLMKLSSKNASSLSGLVTHTQKLAITCSKYSLDYVEKCAGMYKKN